MLQSFIPIALMKTGIGNDHLPPFISLRCYCSAPVQWLDVMGVWLGTLRRMAGVLVMLKDGRQQRNHRLEIATSGCLCSLHSQFSGEIPKVQLCMYGSGSILKQKFSGLQAPLPEVFYSHQLSHLFLFMKFWQFPPGPVSDFPSDSGSASLSIPTSFVSSLFVL